MKLNVTLYIDLEVEEREEELEPIVQAWLDRYIYQLVLKLDGRDKITKYGITEIEMAIGCGEFYEET